MLSRLNEYGLTFAQAASTAAFRSADTVWPFESWDHKEWSRVLRQAKKELTKTT